MIVAPNLTFADQGDQAMVQRAVDAFNKADLDPTVEGYVQEVLCLLGNLDRHLEESWETGTTPLDLEE